MKVEIRLFMIMVPFFVVVGTVYGFMTKFEEPVGFAAILLTGGLALLIGAYLALTARSIDPRPEDSPDGEVSDLPGEQGFFSPHSWWPLAAASCAATCFLGLAVGWWVFGIGAIAGLIAVAGWVTEYSTGGHSH